MAIWLQKTENQIFHQNVPYVYKIFLALCFSHSIFHDFIKGLFIGQELFTFLFATGDSWHQLILPFDSAHTTVSEK